MKRAIGVGMAMAAAAVLAACNTARGEENSGPTVNRAYQVGAFDRIEVAGPYDVTVTTGAGPSVSATGGEKDIEKMVVEVEGRTLKIHMKERKLNFGSRSNRDMVRLQVAVPSLSAAGIAGSGNIAVDKVAGDMFKGEVAGSGNLRLGEVQVKQLKMAIAGSGEIRADGGRVGAANYEIAGSGDIDSGAVVAETAAVSIAGSGNIRANATGAASVDIAGSGDVDLKGGARCTISKAGSGNVRCS